MSRRLLFFFGGLFFNWLDRGDGKDGTLAGFDTVGIGESANGFDSFVFERFKLLGVDGNDFDGTDLFPVDGKDGIEFDGPAGRFSPDGHDAGKLAHDSEFVFYAEFLIGGGLVGLGGKRCGEDEKKSQKREEARATHGGAPWDTAQSLA